MTEEKLINWVDQYSWMGNVSVNTVKKLLSEFFESNVCIPKGENRKQYAYELHAWIEGIEVEAFFRHEENWKNLSSFNCLIVHNDVQYRIKPSEPIYEYFVVDDKGITDWMTIQEFESDNDFKFIAEKTKRIRK